MKTGNIGINRVAMMAVSQGENCCGNAFTRKFSSKYDQRTMVHWRFLFQVAAR
jgi:hypothetical protein